MNRKKNQQTIEENEPTYIQKFTTLASIQYNFLYITFNTPINEKGLRNKVCQFRIIFYMLIPNCSNSVYIFRAGNGFSRIVVHLTIANRLFFLFYFLE